MHRGHLTRRAVEGTLVNAWTARTEVVHSTTAGRLDVQKERRFGWIARRSGLGLAQIERRVVAEGHDAHRGVELVTGRRRRRLITGKEDLGDAHFILGKRASLVGADDAGAAERLRTLQRLEQGLALCHLATCDGEGEGERHGRQESLWNIRDDDADREDKVGPERIADGPSGAKEDDAEADSDDADDADKVASCRP